VTREEITAAGGRLFAEVERRAASALGDRRAGCAGFRRTSSICSLSAAAGARIRLARCQRVVDVENPAAFHPRHRELAMIAERLTTDESVVEIVM
jgi:hypothetical protein